MAERKVLNKWIPPNINPSAPLKKRPSKTHQHKVRLMAPFSMRCLTCGEFIYKGKKYNARKETVKGELYYTIEIFRFYIRCPVCAAEITFKTDPKNTDYIAEKGCSRNFEPWKQEDQIMADLLKEKELEELNNPMKALENRTLDSKRELDIIECLDEIRTKNARSEHVDVSKVLSKIIDNNSTDEDEEYAKQVFKEAREKKERDIIEQEKLFDPKEHIKSVIEKAKDNRKHLLKPRKNNMSGLVRVKPKPNALLVGYSSSSAEE